jgi:hypothetical protein
LKVVFLSNLLDTVMTQNRAHRGRERGSLVKVGYFVQFRHRNGFLLKGVILREMIYMSISQ